MQHTLAILGFQNSELLLIFLVALLFFGGKKIPELARSFGRGISEFKKGVRDVEADIEHSISQPAPPPATPAPQLPPVATADQPQPQPYRFDPYTGKPVANFEPSSNKPA